MNLNMDKKYATAYYIPGFLDTEDRIGNGSCLCFIVCILLRKMYMIKWIQKLKAVTKHNNTQLEGREVLLYMLNDSEFIGNSSEDCEKEEIWAIFLS